VADPDALPLELVDRGAFESPARRNRVELRKEREGVSTGRAVRRPEGEERTGLDVHLTFTEPAS
jgi:hypothetical protein